MKRGDIYYANLRPAMGSEMGKRRPVLIISNNISNSAAKRLFEKCFAVTLGTLDPP